MHKQLLLLHNAIASYFSGNAQALEATLKQFNIKVRVDPEVYKSVDVSVIISLFLCR